MKSPVIKALIFTVSLLFATAVSAQGRHDDNGSMHGMTHTTGKGTITRIDAPGKKITLDHEAIPKFKMEAGTHDFEIKSESTVAKVKEGDKVNFSMEMLGSSVKITRLSKQK
jgi:Cu/Ag efflux protein CusF